MKFGGFILACIVPTLAASCVTLPPVASMPVEPSEAAQRFENSVPWGTHQHPAVGPDLVVFDPPQYPSKQSYLASTLGLYFGVYRQTLSRVDGATCRFEPTCSGFSQHALHAHGPWGIALTFARLQRYHGDASFYEAGRDGRLKDPLERYE